MLKEIIIMEIKHEIRAHQKLARTFTRDFIFVKRWRCIEEIFTVSLLAFKMVSMFISFFFNEIRIEPNAPNEADSVGVATPNKIDPNTIIINIIGGKMVLSILKMKTQDCNNL